jgi:hypothetical protein
MDAEIGLKAVEHLLGTFTAARLRLGRQSLRCEDCGSYQLAAGTCERCGWADPAYEPPTIRKRRGVDAPITRYIFCGDFWLCYWEAGVAEDAVSNGWGRLSGATESARADLTEAWWDGQRRRVRFWVEPVQVRVTRTATTWSGTPGQTTPSTPLSPTPRGFTRSTLNWSPPPHLAAPLPLGSD